MQVKPPPTYEVERLVARCMTHERPAALVQALGFILARLPVTCYFWFNLYLLLVALLCHALRRYCTCYLLLLLA